jgi:hypothetical protein
VQTGWGTDALDQYRFVDCDDGIFLQIDIRMDTINQ